MIIVLIPHLKTLENFYSFLEYYIKGRHSVNSFHIVYLHSGRLSLSTATINSYSFDLYLPIPCLCICGFLINYYHSNLFHK